MDFFYRNWPGILMALSIFSCGVLYRLNYEQTLYSPSGGAMIIQDLGGPDYCMVDINPSRSSNQVWTDLTWCLANAKTLRQEAGLP